MRLDDCYKLLEIAPTASDDEVKNAHRDLTKVWHPDRFQSDPAMQLRAQEKLKSLNEAYETIKAARQGSSRWRVMPDDRAPEMRVASPPPVRLYAFLCAGLALFILVRRPTPGGFILALVLFGVSFLMLLRTARK